MESKKIKRFWIKESRWKERKANTGYYQSSAWRTLRTAFIASPPWIDLKPIGGINYSNRYCADCWEKGVLNDQRIEIDHITRREDGGKDEISNLRSRCHKHHSAKSAKESNESKREKK